MLLKNWLIRTKSNHILGPVSKAKIIELYKSNSVKPDDELCSGNGYWFFVKEKSLIEKYLLAENIQEFNPISEAKDVLLGTTSTTGFIEVKKIEEKGFAIDDEIKYPTNDDLDYPDMGSMAPLKAAEPAKQVIEEKTPELPKTSVAAEQAPKDTPEKKTESVTITPPKRREVPLKKKSIEPPKTVIQNNQSSKLYWTMIVLAVIVVIAIYFRKGIAKKLNVQALSMIESVQAQEIAPQKKNFFSFLH